MPVIDVREHQFSGDDWKCVTHSVLFQASQGRPEPSWPNTEGPMKKERRLPKGPTPAGVSALRLWAAPIALFVPVNH